MVQCNTAQSPQPLVTSLEGQWPPTPVLMAMSLWVIRTGHVWWMEHGQELSHNVDVHIFIFGVILIDVIITDLCLYQDARQDSISHGTF